MAHSVVISDGVALAGHELVGCELALELRVKSPQTPSAAFDQLSNLGNRFRRAREPSILERRMRVAERLGPSQHPLLIGAPLPHLNDRPIRGVHTHERWVWVQVFEVAADRHCLPDADSGIELQHRHKCVPVLLDVVWAQLGLAAYILHRQCDFLLREEYSHPPWIWRDLPVVELHFELPPCFKLLAARLGCRLADQRQGADFLDRYLPTFFSR